MSYIEINKGIAKWENCFFWGFFPISVWIYFLQVCYIVLLTYKPLAPNCCITNQRTAEYIKGITLTTCHPPPKQKLEEKKCQHL